MSRSLFEHDPEPIPEPAFFAVMEDLERPDSTLVEFFDSFRGYLDACHVTDLIVTPEMMPEWRGVLLALQAMPASLRRAFGLPVPERSCRVCGCTDDEGCPEGCWWVADDRCSACAAGDGR